MNLEEALNPLQTVSVEDAKHELMKHGVPSYIEGGFNHCYLYGEIEAEDGTIEETMICQIIDGEVYSNELMQWLGY